jgi:XRE family transcriptional regulator, fatty acid utilization regulator
MKTNEEILRELGSRIRVAREKLEWTQADLASKMETSTAHISLLENGKREPGLFMLRKLVRILSIKFKDLIEES